MPASALMNVMLAAARKAARSLARDFGEVEQLQVSLKGPANFVTAADHRAEEILHAELARARPGYGFLLEERGEIEGADRTHRFIVDPLDGTTNYLHGIPHFAISIALEREGELVASLILNPASQEIFTAEKGKGAYLNDRRIRVAARTDLADTVIGTGIPHSGRPAHDLFLAELRAVMATAAGVRRLGAASLDLAWTAAGRLDGFWERNLKPWDLAAGIVVLREAGGFVSDAAGKDAMLAQGSVVAGNEAIQRNLLKLLKTAGS
ncbi:MAG TPA: inositol monophosphatase family protein [Methyloceanibacter sp.]|nr:inositol monophosphatase family protein [Methyloceanibacter sp.]